MTHHPEPPRLAERFLLWSMPDSEWRDAVAGDLREEFHVLSGRHGRPAAARWYWHQALRLAMRFATTRLLRQPAPARPWVAPADLDRAPSGLALGRDLRHAWRSIARRPAVAAVIVSSLALAIAANATVFSLLDSIALRPFRFAGVDRLVLIASDNPQNPLLDRESVAPADLADWRRDARTVADLTAVEWWEPNLSGIENPEKIPGFKVSPGYFELLGARPALGRTFLPEEATPGADRRAVIAYSLWTRRFAADPAIVGRTIRLDGEQYEVVGVAPEGFGIPMGSEAWAPLAKSPTEWNDRKAQGLIVIGRLADGRTLDQARQEFGAINDRLAETYPETNAQRPIRVETFNAGMADPGAGGFVGVTQAAAFLLLVIACANIANLLLARGVERTQEYGLRLALGASRLRIAWVTMLEGVLLAGLAVLASLPLAYAGLGALRSAFPPSLVRFVPGWEYVGVSLTLLAAMSAVGVAAAMAFSIVPAFQATRAGVADTLRQVSRTSTSGRQRLWLRGTLAVTQVAISLALLGAAALVVGAAREAIDGNLGFDKRNVLTASIVLPERPYDDVDRRRQFAAQVIERLRTLPAAQSVAVTNAAPYAGFSTTRAFIPEGVDLRPEDAPRADYRRVGGDIFPTLGLPVLAGRAFTELDREGALDVGIISTSLAERYWPGADPIGRRFRLAENAEWITIVGVVPNVRHHWIQSLSVPTVYRPSAQDPAYQVTLLVRTVGEPYAIATALRQEVARLDPDVPVQRPLSLEDLVLERSTGLTFIAQIVAVVAFIAAVLAITGLYSLMAFLASRREREIGVRIALGAGWWDIVRATTMPALRITVAGVVMGTLLAAWAGTVMKSALLGSVTNDYQQLGVLAVTLTAVALVASYIPARRAAAADPTTALRAE